MSESPAFDIFERTGVDEVLDEHGAIIYSEVREEDVPPEDLQFLRDCGIRLPAEEVTNSLTRLRFGYRISSDGKRHRIATGEVLHVARQTIGSAASQLRPDRDQPQTIGSPPPHPPSRKPKKYFNGIGKILSGVVADTGNVMIGAGAIPATGGGAAAAGVIASAAVSIGLVMQVIGDLRGE